MAEKGGGTEEKKMKRKRGEEKGRKVKKGRRVRKEDEGRKRENFACSEKVFAYAGAT